MWLKFFSGSNKTSETYRIDRSEFSSSSAITEAIDILNYYRMSIKDKNALAAAVKNEDDYLLALQDAKAKGHEEGKAEGIAEGKDAVINDINAITAKINAADSKALQEIESEYKDSILSQTVGLLISARRQLLSVQESECKKLKLEQDQESQ